MLEGLGSEEDETRVGRHDVFSWEKMRLRGGHGIRGNRAEHRNANLN